MTRATVVLFDIDGTLVLTGGAGRRAMRRAFVDEFGSGDVLESFSFGGMTDYLILRTALEGVGVAWSDALRDRILDRYVEHLTDELPRADRYTIMPGVGDVLAALAAEAGIAIGLGTGNIERGARLKLGRGDLNRHFAFGGFGSDGEDRAELLRRGAERGAAQLGLRIDDCDVVVVGDTVRDADAAHAIGARAVLVETGGVDRAVLTATGAQSVFRDLLDPASVAAILRR
ncbi:MAG: HAD hydrolase-like protein [Myxococcales bacterium]|nr:HAD hydrolase-like protein [Myxococcales bacterium]